MTIPEVPQHQPGSGVRRNSGGADDATIQHEQSRIAIPAVADAEAPSPPAKRRSQTYIFGVIGLVLGALLGVIGTITIGGMVEAGKATAAAEAEAKKPKPLADAVNKCQLSGKAISAKLGDDGRSLSLDGQGEEDLNGLAWSDIQCVLKAVNVPDYVQEQMKSTRALDGTQRESWDNFSVSWSYHPNTGMNVVLRFTDV